MLNSMGNRAGLCVQILDILFLADDQQGILRFQLRIGGRGDHVAAIAMNGQNVDAVLAAVNDEQNLVEKEHKIDMIRWNESVELTAFDYFNINAVLAYLVRVNIVARWSMLDPERGRELFAQLMQSLDGKDLIK